MLKFNRKKQKKTTEYLNNETIQNYEYRIEELQKELDKAKEIGKHDHEVVVSLMILAKLFKGVVTKK